MLELNPRVVWNYFEKISKIPRCSKNEERVGEYIKEIARERNLEFQQDEAGNIVIRKPGTKSSDSSITILQAHMDMVCEKNEGVDHDFSTDPIPLRKAGNWITAEGTTLGADNGIGLAVCLAVLTSEEIEHDPLEFLFTVNEETGLTGASKLEPGLLSGKRLINLDGEGFCKFIIGCAGGGKSKVSLPVRTEKRSKTILLTIRISGLKGGHSGEDINKGRANSIKILGRLLWELHHSIKKKTLIHEIAGGNKDNAIPRESVATIVVEGSTEEIENLLLEEFKDIKNEYEDIEENMRIRIKKEKENSEIKLFDHESSKKSIYIIQALPHGVLAMNQKIGDLVKTSTNLAKVSRKNNKLEIKMSTRSDTLSRIETVRDQIQVIGEIFGAKVEEDQPYPSWEPNTDSELVKTLKKTFRETFNIEPEEEVIHAGLETGIIGQKFDDMDMVSIGPEIRNPHSPQEKVNIETVKKLWKHLMKSLKALSDS